MFTRLPDNICHVSSLQELAVEQMQGGQIVLPERFGMLSNLRRLDLVLRSAERTDFLWQPEQPGVLGKDLVRS